MKSKFGKKIDRLQAEKGISVNELAVRSGFSRQSLTQMKKSRKPNMVTIHRIAKAFEVDVDVFLEIVE